MQKEKQIKGLCGDEIENSRKKHGANKLTGIKRHSFFSQFIASFNDPIIKILLVALFANTVFWINNFNPYESIGILLAILLSTLISSISEYGSEGAFIAMLEENSKIECTVIRNGERQNIFSEDIVCGDAVCLCAGEKIPCDGTIIYGTISVNQSFVNGESNEIEKKPSRLKQNVMRDFYSESKAFGGSIVCSGEAVMTADEVGDATYYGHIARELDGNTSKGPLKKRLSSLARIISRLGYFAASLVVLADIFNRVIIDNGFDRAKILSVLCSPNEIFGIILHALMLGLGVVVVAVPEGLPMMIGVILSRNIVKMKKNNVLVRRPVGIETAGSINILFTDKTGTLTYGDMSVCALIMPDGTQISPDEFRKNKESMRLLSLCATLAGGAYYNKTEKKAYGGNSTDRAIINFCADACKNIDDNISLEEKIPFTSENKYCLAKISSGMTFIKGAPEVLLQRCVGCNKKAVMQQMSKCASAGARVILCAYGTGGLSLLCLCVLSDRVRKSADKSIKTLASAGIHTVMVTGDSRDTALEIAKQSGILNREHSKVITSDELAAMTDDEIKSGIKTLAVVARAKPQDKSRLVTVCREAGYVCAMTGDGINDAPALKKADVGFSMGSGAQVAKEAGDIVILDDDISSITKAVLFGRTIFKSIRKFLVFQLTMNFCAVGILLVAPLIGYDTPVTVIQMLWINIIMDTLAGLAFAGEAPREEYMKEKPILQGASVITRKMAGQIACAGIFIFGLLLWFLKSNFVMMYFDGRESAVSCGFFGLFVFSGMFNCFNARTHRANIFSHLGQNKSFIFIILFVFLTQLLLMYFGGSVFRCCPLTLQQLVFILILSFSVIPFDVVRKKLAKL